jgi:tRNA (guanosine-2'-O-)-methyltransferase
MNELLEFFSEFITEERKSKIEEVLSFRTHHFRIVVEDTYQEHNASALVRSCDCFGIQNFTVIRHINDFNIYHGMARGAEKWIDINYYDQDQDGVQLCIDQMKKDGYQIVATSPDPNSSRLEDFDITKKSAIFFGRERHGLSQEIIDQADENIMIPMVGFIRSFNISVSLAIILNTLTPRLRENSSIDWQLTQEEKTKLRLAWYYKSLPNGQRMLTSFLKTHPEFDTKKLKEIITY